MKITDEFLVNMPREKLEAEVVRLRVENSRLKGQIASQSLELNYKDRRLAQLEAQLIKYSDPKIIYDSIVFAPTECEAKKWGRLSQECEL